MDRAAAEHLQKFIAMLFDSQASLELVTTALDQLQSAIASEEVGGMQKMNVQPVAFDPFAAIQQSSQATDFRQDGDFQRSLQGMHATHLVGDRPKAANS